MQNLRRYIFFIMCITALLFAGCHSKIVETEQKVPQTPVSVTTIKTKTISENIELNATSAFLLKSVIKASTNGYLKSVDVQVGKAVSKNQILFTIISKEAKSIGNTINKLDPSFRFSGLTHIKAHENGNVSFLNHQKGDYVLEGEPLATISNSSSFVFLLDLPYELKNTLKNQKTVVLTLPDGEILKGLVTSALPTVDSASQTQRIIIKVNNTHPIPENLIAKVSIIKTEKDNTTSIQKSAVLTNETESEFWVMKMINDTTAVKTIIKKGIETANEIEIISPKFLPTDRIISVGNYGLSDTAKVKIVK
jgi:biotin carboxyl carrier protein